MSRIWVIARITFHEAVRKRLLMMALLAGASFLLLFGTALHFQEANSYQSHLPPLIRRQVNNGMLVVGMYAINFLLVAMTVLTSADTLSGEIASGTMQAIAMKPIFRWELLAGKWLGFCGVLTLYALTMAAGLNCVTWAIAGVYGRHLALAFGLMWMESMLLLTVTLMLSTTFSTLTTGAMVLGMHGLAFLGGWIEQAGSMTNTPNAVLAGVAASLIMPSESLWRRAAFELQSPLAAALNNFSPFSAMSVPSPAMIVYAALYTCLMFGLTAWQLNRRDL